jgi:hypothetical protein
MKNLTIKYKYHIEVLVSILGLILTVITLQHNLTYINTFISFHSFQLEVENLKLHSIEVIFFFLPIQYRKKIHHFYEKYVPTIAWGNLIFFVAVTITTNYIMENPLMHHIGVLTIAEFVVLLFEKKPVEKFHKIIDTINSIFN